MTVSIVQANVADATAISVLFARFGADLAPLAGVFHVAADMSSHTLAELDRPAYESMVAPKVGGAWLLHRLTSELTLDCFVLFSSSTALLGAQGLAHYAAANAALDSLAHARRAAGLPALSINWGTWERMRLASAQAQAFFESAGLRPMPASEALGMLELALQSRPSAARDRLDRLGSAEAHLRGASSEALPARGCGCCRQPAHPHAPMPPGPAEPGRSMKCRRPSAAKCWPSGCALKSRE